MNLQDDDFTLFGVPQQFAQDRTHLNERWKALQREAHPDKFAAWGHAAQRVALQMSARINQAHDRLKDPLKRAAYLCELRGVPIDAERNTAMAGPFLMLQMAWREELEEAKTEQNVQKIAESSSIHALLLLQQIEQLLDSEPADLVGAAARVREGMFIAKFQLDLHRALDRLAV